MLNQQNFRNLISLVFESVKFSPSQFFCLCFTNFSERFAFSCMFCLTAVVSYVFFQHFREKLTRGCARLNHLRMLYVWPLSCHMQWSRKIKTIPDSFRHSYYSKCAKWFEVSYRSCNKRRHLFFFFVSVFTVIIFVDRIVITWFSTVSSFLF